MGTEIGQVNISLRMSLAQFKTDVKDGADAASAGSKQIASDMGSSMSEARGSVMLLSEEVGVHLPRHLTNLIAQIPGLTAAFSAMLPIIGVVAAIKVIDNLVEAHNKAKEAMATAMAEMGASGATVLGNLNEKLDASKLKFLELADDGAGVAALKLDMLSHTTLTSLIGAFDNLGKSITDVLDKMGTTGTIARIMGLSGASDAVKNLQKDVLSIRASDETDAEKAAAIGQKIEWYKNKAKSDMDKMLADQAAAENAPDDAPAGGNYTDKQIVAQKALYATLNDMAKASAITQQTQAVDTANIQTEATNKATAEEEKIWLARNAEYQRGLKSDEAAEQAAYTRAVSNIQEGEKLKIDATRQGTQARLDAVLAAIRDEEAHGLQDTAYYKSLQEQKVTIAQDMANQQIQLARKTAEEMAKAQQSMIALNMAGDKEQADFEYKLGTATIDQHIQALRDEAAQELALEQQKNEAVLREMSTNDPLYPIAVQKRLDADLQAQAKYENQMVSLDHQAVEARKAEWDAGFNAMNSGMSTLVTDMVKGNSSITADLKSMLSSMLSSWINYFAQLELKAAEAALFMRLQGVLQSGSFVSGVPGMDASSMPSGGALPGGMPSSVFHATGGHMDAGEFGIVGDAGPEAWVPDTGGRVVPMSDMKGGKSEVHHHQNTLININGVTDFDSFKQNQAQVSAQLFASMAAAARRKG